LPLASIAQPRPLSGARAVRQGHQFIAAELASSDGSSATIFMPRTLRESRIGSQGNS
jgi:hypothetical protein